MAVKRKSVKISKNDSKTLDFLYKNYAGRTLLKVLTQPAISKAAGMLLSTKPSALMIKGFVRKNRIDLSEYESVNYGSYNEFFTRKVIKDKRPVDYEDKHLISPCDAKLLVYNINKDSRFRIKGSLYSVSDLLQNESLAEEFSGGLCLIFRLTVDDYHRYCYFDSGKKSENYFITGKLHTVQPIALDTVNIYKQNSREYTVMETANFGRAIQVEVGALMVGKIRNLHETHIFSKGEEKGWFEFGGSTVVLLLKKGIAEIDRDILDNSSAGKETVVKYGEKIGKALGAKRRKISEKIT